jgi:hypothetical protein
MLRRVVAGLLLGLIVFAAASIVSRGLHHPEFLNPDLNPVRDAKAATATRALRS